MSVKTVESFSNQENFSLNFLKNTKINDSNSTEHKELEAKDSIKGKNKSRLVGSLLKKLFLTEYDK